MIIWCFIRHERCFGWAIIVPAGCVEVTERNIGIYFIDKIFQNNIQVVGRNIIGGNLGQVILVKALRIYKTVRNPVIEILDGLFVAPEEIYSPRIAVARIIYISEIPAVGIRVIGQSLFTYQVVIAFVISLR